MGHQSKGGQEAMVLKESQTSGLLSVHLFLETVTHFLESLIPSRE